jgi:hypothetical protein
MTSSSSSDTTMAADGGVTTTRTVDEAFADACDDALRAADKGDPSGRMHRDRGRKDPSGKADRPLGLSGEADRRAEHEHRARRAKPHRSLRKSEMTLWNAVSPIFADEFFPLLFQRLTIINEDDVLGVWRDFVAGDRVRKDPTDSVSAGCRPNDPEGGIGAESASPLRPQATTQSIVEEVPRTNEGKPKKKATTVATQSIGRQASATQSIGFAAGVLAGALATTELPLTEAMMDATAVSILRAICTRENIAHSGNKTKLINNLLAHQKRRATETLQPTAAAMDGDAVIGFAACGRPTTANETRAPYSSDDSSSSDDDDARPTQAEIARSLPALPLAPEALRASSVADLRDICRREGVACSGAKEKLIKVLLMWQNMSDDGEPLAPPTDTRPVHSGDGEEEKEIGASPIAAKKKKSRTASELIATARAHARQNMEEQDGDERKNKSPMEEADGQARDDVPTTTEVIVKKKKTKKVRSTPAQPIGFAGDVLAAPIGRQASAAKPIICVAEEAASVVSDAAAVETTTTKKIKKRVKAIGSIAAPTGTSPRDPPGRSDAVGPGGLLPVGAEQPSGSRELSPERPPATVPSGGADRGKKRSKNDDDGKRRKRSKTEDDGRENGVGVAPKKDKKRPRMVDMTSPIGSLGPSGPGATITGHEGCAQSAVDLPMLVPTAIIAADIIVVGVDDQRQQHHQKRRLTSQKANFLHPPADQQQGHSGDAIDPDTLPDLIDMKTEETSSASDNAKKMTTRNGDMMDDVEETPLRLVTDEFNNVYEANTGFVLNGENKVIGRKDEDGHVQKLTRRDVDECAALLLEPDECADDDEA